MLDWQGKRWLKIISVALIIAFITYDIAWATDFSSIQKKQYISRSLFKNKKVDHETIKAENEANLNNIKDALSHKKNNYIKDFTYHKDLNNALKASYIKDIANIYIPDTIGKVVDSYTSPDSKATIIHIQDLHTNPEASLNLAGILETLIKDYNLDLVCSEGASGIVDTSSVSSFPDKEVREKVARLFINSGELTGEEYLSIVKFPNLPIWGIEDKDTYFQHIVEFNKIMKFSTNALTFIRQVKEALDKLKPKIYSKALIDLDSKEIEYEESRVETNAYLDYLLSLRPGLDISKYENIIIFRDSLEAEKTIDHAKIIKESQGLLLDLQSILKDKDNKSEIESLLTKAALYKDKKISPFSFYSYLDELARRHLKEDINKYPDLIQFVDYLTKINSLDSLKLFQELEELTCEIKDLISDNANQKLLTKSLRNIKFLENFFNLKISNIELQYYLKDKDNFKVTFFESFLKENLRKYNIDSFIDFNPDLIDKNLPDLENFYELAHKRDLSMFNNATSEIETRKPKLTALIAGGFHTQGITKFLKDNNYSYVVISPYSKTGIDEENYRNLLSGKRKPLKELISELNEKLRSPMGFVNKRFREEFKRKFNENIGLIDRFSLAIVLVAIGVTIRKAKSETRPMEKIGAMFNKLFKETLEDSIEIRRDENTDTIYIRYKEQYVLVTHESKIEWLEDKSKFEAAAEIAIIRSQGVLTAEQRIQGLDMLQVTLGAGTAAGLAESGAKFNWHLLETEIARLTSPQEQYRYFRTYPASSVLDALGLNNEDTYLDLAGGPGTYILTAATSYNVKQAIYLDISRGNLLLTEHLLRNASNMTTEERNRLLDKAAGQANVATILQNISRRGVVEHSLPENVSILLGDARNMKDKIEDNSITKLSVTELFNWLGGEEGVRQCIEEILRVVKGGGRIFIVYDVTNKESLSSFEKTFKAIAEERGISIDFQKDTKTGIDGAFIVDVIGKTRVATEFEKPADMQQAALNAKLIAIDFGRTLTPTNTNIIPVDDFILECLSVMDMLLVADNELNIHIISGGATKEYIDQIIGLFPSRFHMLRTSGRFEVDERVTDKGQRVQEILHEANLPESAVIAIGNSKETDSPMALTKGYFVKVYPHTRSMYPNAFDVLGHILEVKGKAAIIGSDAQPPFMGTYSIKLDRYRLMLPAALRRLIKSNRIDLLPNENGIISMIESQEGKYALARDGRFNIGRAIKDLSDFKADSEVILVGVGNKVEIWPEEKFTRKFRYPEEPGIVINITRTQDGRRAFFGTYSRIVGEKSRIEIPTELRSRISSGKVVLQAISKSLVRIFDQEEWLRLVKEQSLPDTIFASAYCAELDTNGRVLIPEGLQQFVDFKTGSKVKLIGAGEFLELYLEEAYQKPAKVLGGLGKVAANEESIAEKYTVSIDSKGRLTIPEKYREKFKPGMTLLLQPTNEGANFILTQPLMSQDEPNSLRAIKERNERKKNLCSLAGEGLLSEYEDSWVDLFSAMSGLPIRENDAYYNIYFWVFLRYWLYGIGHWKKEIKEDERGKVQEKERVSSDEQLINGQRIVDSIEALLMQLDKAVTQQDVQQLDEEVIREPIRQIEETALPVITLSMITPADLEKNPELFKQFLEDQPLTQEALKWALGYIKDYPRDRHQLAREWGFYSNISPARSLMAKLRVGEKHEAYVLYRKLAYAINNRVPAIVPSITVSTAYLRKQPTLFRQFLEESPLTKDALEWALKYIKDHQGINRRELAKRWGFIKTNKSLERSLMSTLLTRDKAPELYRMLKEAVLKVRVVITMIDVKKNPELFKQFLEDQPLTQEALSWALKYINDNPGINKKQIAEKWGFHTDKRPAVSLVKTLSVGLSHENYRMYMRLKDAVYNTPAFIIEPAGIFAFKDVLTNPGNFQAWLKSYLISGEKIDWIEAKEWMTAFILIHRESSQEELLRLLGFPNDKQPFQAFRGSIVSCLKKKNSEIEESVLNFILSSIQGMRTEIRKQRGKPITLSFIRIEHLEKDPSLFRLWWNSFWLKLTMRYERDRLDTGQITENINWAISAIKDGKLGSAADNVELKDIEKVRVYLHKLILRYQPFGYKIRRYENIFRMVDILSKVVEERVQSHLEDIQAIRDEATGILNALDIPTKGIEGQITIKEAQDAWFNSAGKFHEAVKLIVDKRVKKIRNSDKAHIEAITIKQKRKINPDLVYVLLDRFPDGELYLRLINSERIKGTYVTVNHSLSSASDFIELFFLTYALGYYGAKGIEIDLKDWRPRFYENGSMYEEDKALLIILNACAEGVVIKSGSNALSIPKVPEFERKGLPLLTDDISFTDQRFASLANFEARKLGYRPNCITVESAVPGHWDVTCESPAENRGITLLNSMTSDEEIVHLLMASAVLRNKGAKHIAYLDLLQAYGRQDKVFLNGEIVSAEAMLKALHIFGDKIVTNNPHFADETGWIKFDNFDIHAVSSFIPLGEYMFCEVVKEIVKREFGEDIDVSNLTREQHKVLGKKFEPLLLSEFEKHPLLLVSPDKGAALLEQEAAKLLEAYIKREFGIEIKIYSGAYNKKRHKITRKTTMWGPIMGPDETPLAIGGKKDLSDCWVFILDDTTATGGTVFQATYLAHFEDKIEWKRILSGIVHVDFSKRDNPFNHDLSEGDIVNGKIPEPDHANKMLIPRGLWTTQSYPPTVSKVEPEHIVPLTDLIKYVIEKVLIDTTGVPEAVKDPSVSAKVFPPIETGTHWDSIAKACWLGRGKSNNPEDIADYILSEYDALDQSISTLPETMQEQVNKLGILKCSRDIFGWLSGAQIDPSITLDRVISEAQGLRDLLFELTWDAEARESDAAYRWMKRYSNIWTSTYELLRLYHNGNLILTHTVYMRIFGEVYKGLFFIQRLATEEVRELEALSLERIDTIKSEVKEAVDDILIYPPVRQAVHILSKDHNIEEEKEQLICRLFERVIAKNFIEHRPIRSIVEEEFTNMPQEIKTLQDWLTIDSLSSYIEMVIAGNVSLPYKVYQEEDLGQGLSRIVVEPDIESSNIIFLKYWDKKDRGYAFVVIDGGSPQFMPTLKAKVFKELGITDPAKQIKRIIFTHGDPGHLGILEIASEYNIPFRADPYLFTTVWDRGLPRKVLSQSFTSDLTRIARGFVELDQETLKRLFQPYPEKQAEIFLKGLFFDFLDDEIIGDTDWAVVRAEGFGHSFESLMLIQWPDTVERITVPEAGSDDVRLPPYVIVKAGNSSEAIPFNAQIGDEKRVEAEFQSRIRSAIEIWVGLREKVIDIISGDMGVEGKAMPKGQSRMVKAYLQMTGQVPDIEPVYGRSIHSFITGFRGARITPSHGSPYVNTSSVKTESLDKVKPVVIVTGAGELAADCIIKTLKERGYMVLATAEDPLKAESLSKGLGIEVVCLNIEADAGLRKRIEKDVIERAQKDSKPNNPIVIVNTHNDPGFVRTIAEISTQLKRQVFLIHLGSAASYQPNERISDLVALEKSQDLDTRRMQLAEDTIEGVDTISPFPYVILRLPFLLGPERNPIGDVYKGMPSLARWFRYASSESIKPWLEKPAIIQHFLTADTLGYIALGVILGLKEPMMWRNMFYAPEGIPISPKLLINIWRWRSQQDKVPSKKSPVALHLLPYEIRTLERMFSKDYPVFAPHTAALRLQYLLRRLKMLDDNAKSELPEDILDKNPITSQINYTFKAAVGDMSRNLRSSI